MLTNTMPAVVKALQKTLDPTTLKAFTQALGNCNQPVTQRGQVTVQPNNYFLRAGEYPTNNTNIGYSSYNYQQYNPTFLNYFAPQFPPFNPLFPDPNPPISILPPDLTPGDVRIDLGDTITNNINNNINNSSFFFPTTNVFNNIGGPTNNFFGGDTYIDRSYTDNSTTNNSNVSNLYVTNINGNPVQGPTGPPGQPGADGRDGRDGAPGAPGMLVPVPFPIIVPPQVPPPPQAFPSEPLRVVDPGEVFVDGLKTKVQQVPYEVYTYSFDPSTCTLSQATETKLLDIPATDVSSDTFPVSDIKLRPPQVLVPNNNAAGQ